MSVESHPLLSSSSSPPPPPSRPSFSADELTSFPCLSPSTTTKAYNLLVSLWMSIHRYAPCAHGLLQYCEDHELMGPWLIGTFVAIFILTGWFTVLQGLSGTICTVCQIIFVIQVILGYTCLYLFRNIDPGYLPINEGPIDPETLAMLQRPEYLQTALILTRPFQPDYSAEELEQQHLKRLENEASGNYEHENIYGEVQQVLEQEWCRTCRIWRPPRAAHCYVCQQCVLRNDHHCGLLGNCVGVRNHRFFIGFIFFVGSGATTLLISTLIWLCQLFFSEGCTSTTGLAFFLLIPFGLGSCTTFISYFHIWMLMMDVTMREKYGRKRSSFESSNMKTKEKMKEIWKEIFLTTWKWKGKSVALRQKQQARKDASDPYRSQKHLEAASPIALAIANGDEQIGCDPAGVGAGPTLATGANIQMSMHMTNVTTTTTESAGKHD